MYKRAVHFLILQNYLLSSGKRRKSAGHTLVINVRYAIASGIFAILSAFVRVLTAAPRSIRLKRLTNNRFGKSTSYMFEEISP